MTLARSLIFVSSMALQVIAPFAWSASARAEPPPALPAAADAGPTAAADWDQVRRGVVQIEQAGRPIAIGTVLSKDGRVLTSLSGLRLLEQPEIRYADGSVVRAKVGHKDQQWDLALLVPQTGKWPDGLVASDINPQGVDLTSFLPKTGKLAPSVVGFKGRIDARSRDGEALLSLLDLDLKGSPAVPGAPVVDPSGKVVGIVIRVCKERGGPPPVPAGSTPACSPLTAAAPVYALRGFLVKTPASAVAPAPWLGLGGAASEAGNVRGVRVMGLAPGSPAEKSGLKAGGDAPDTIVAVDGQPLESPEQLAEIIGKRAIGQQVKLLVFNAGKFRDVTVTLRPSP